MKILKNNKTGDTLIVKQHEIGYQEEISKNDVNDYFNAFAFKIRRRTKTVKKVGIQKLY